MRAGAQGANLMRRHTRRAATLASVLITNALFLACPSNQVPRSEPSDDRPGEKEDKEDDDGGPSTPVDGPSGIDVQLAAPSAHPLGLELTVDGGGTSQDEGRLLTYAWEVSAPDGDECAPALSDTTLPTLTFTPLCAGPHDVTLTASTVEGKREAETVRVDVVQVTVAFGDIVPAPRGQAAEVFVEVEQGAIASGVLTTELEATPREPFTAIPEVTGDGNPFLVPMLDPLATYDLVARVKAGDVVVSAADATALVTALNTAPVVSNLRLDPGPFAIGGTTTLLADVVDAEGDDVTCSASVTAGDATGFEIAPATATPESGTCAFTLTTPARLEQWTLTVTADDGNVASLPATLEVQPENDPPSLSVTVEGPGSRGYTCVGLTACASEDFTLVLSIADDIDPLEALAVEIAVDGGVLPDGLDLVVEPHATAPDKRVVRFERDTSGPLKGVWPLTVTVTEATALDDLVASTSQTVELEVTNLAPSAVPQAATTSDHAYSAGEGYTATVDVAVDVTDPEGAALEVTPTLVSCPTAAAGAAACGGAEVEVELLDASVLGEARAVYALRSSSLAALVGTFTFALTLTDPDGGSVTVSDLTAEVTNHAPVVVATRSVEHSYSGGQYRASFSDLWADPDGDPLTVNLQVRCPGGQTVAFGQGCNGSTPVVTESDADVSVTSTGGSSSGFLGSYQLRGTISDGAATVGGAGTTVSTLTVRNRAPASPSFVAGTSRVACDHKTTSGTVTNDPSCSFLVTFTGTDPDGDPARLRLRTSAPFTFTNPSATPLTTTSPRSRSFDLTLPFDDFKSDQTATVRAYLEDAFGEESAEVPVDVEFLNRAPVWGNASVMTPRKMESVFGILETRAVGFIGTVMQTKYEDFDRWEDRAGATERAYGPKPCLFGSCGSTMPFSLTLDVSDPDGDPLEVLPVISCTGGKSPLLNGQPLGAWRPLQGTLEPYLAWNNSTCTQNNNDVQADIITLAGSIVGIRCTLDTLTAARDHIDSTRIPDGKVRMWRVRSGATEATCE